MPGTRFNLSITSSGGGGLPGDATVWGSVGNWSGLDDIVGPLRTGDFAEVDDLGPDGSTGTAMYNGADWGLHRAVFATVADLLAFGGGGELILADAIAFVGTGAETDPVYYYAGGEWVRTPDGTGYVHPQVNNVTELLAIPDPKNNDRVFVLNTGQGTAGWAVYYGSWFLDQGSFSTVADMEAFSSEPEFNSVKDEAIVSIGGVGSMYPHYVYLDGTNEWVRTPEDTKYIWPNALNWAGLPDNDSLRNGDEAFVEFLGTTTSYGTARWSDVIPDWELKEGTFAGWDPVVFETDFPGIIAQGAILRSDDGSWEAPIYFYDTTGPQWVRSPQFVTYNWPQRSTWSDLGSISGMVDGDRAQVALLGPTGSSGVARYEGVVTDQWQLEKGVFATAADMATFTATPRPIQGGALATIGTGAEAETIYFYDSGLSTWVRTPADTKYIWPQVNNWSELTTLRPHAINNDEVHVQTLGTTHSSGTAQLHGGTWKLIEGKWTSIILMIAWNQGPIHEGAIGFVDASFQYDEDSSVFYYTGGAWVATQPVGVTKVHTISSIYDFSASGLADGDYGVLTPSGGSPIVLRYKAACTVAAGGTRAVWMTPTAYAGSPVLQAWTDGTENNATLAAQGWTLAIGTGCSLGPTGGYQRMATPGSQVSVSLAAMSGAITSTTKVESIYECRGSIPGGSTVRSKQFYLADGVNGYSIGDSGAGGSNGYGYRQAATGAIVNTPIRDVTSARIPALAATPFVCVARDEGRTVFASLSVNGNAFADYRRNLGSIAASIFYVYITGDITAPITMDYRGQVLTY